MFADAGAWIVVLITAAVFLSLIWEKLPSDVVAMLAFAALLATGSLSVNDALVVFSNPAPITIAAMFVLSASLEKTGVIARAGGLISAVARNHSPLLAIIFLVAATLLLSAFVNNTPVVIVLVPVAIGLAKTIGISSSRLLIPLSFLAILGGNTTLIGSSTNLLVDGVAQEAGLAPFGMFEISAAGLIMAAVGVSYLAVFGRWLLPHRPANELESEPAVGETHHSRTIVTRQSAWFGTRLSRLRASGVDVVDIQRGGYSLRHGSESRLIAAGDLVVYRHHGTSPTADEAPPADSYPVVRRQLLVSAQSTLVGTSWKKLGIARMYRTYPLGLARQGQPVGATGDLVVKAGDALTVEGPPSGLERLVTDRELKYLDTDAPALVPALSPRSIVAVLAIVAVMAAASLSILPIAGAAIIGAATVVALGCIDRLEAYRAIRWDLMMLIFGMLALGHALDSSGAAQGVVNMTFAQFDNMPPLVMLAGIYLVTSLITEVMSNNASAIMLTPIALAVADQIGLDARPFVVAVMFAASASFATPIGYQTNTMVYTAGHYRFADFLKIGVPMNILMFATAMIVIPIFWPLVDAG